MGLSVTGQARVGLDFHERGLQPFGKNPAPLRLHNNVGVRQCIGLGAAATEIVHPRESDWKRLDVGDFHSHGYSRVLKNSDTP